MRDAITIIPSSEGLSFAGGKEWMTSRRGFVRYKLGTV